MQICSINQSNLPLSVPKIVGITLVVTTTVFLIFCALNASGILQLLSKTQAYCSLISIGIPFGAVLISISLRAFHKKPIAPPKQPLTIQEKGNLLLSQDCEAIATYIKNNPQDTSFKQFGLQIIYMAGNPLTEKYLQMPLEPDEALEFGCMLENPKDRATFALHHKIKDLESNWKSLRANVLLNMNREEICEGFVLARMNGSKLDPRFVHNFVKLDLKYNTTMSVKTGDALFCLLKRNYSQACAAFPKSITQIETIVSVSSKKFRRQKTFLNMMGEVMFKIMLELQAKSKIEALTKSEQKELDQIVDWCVAFTSDPKLSPQILKKLNLKNETYLTKDSLPFTSFISFLSAIKPLANVAYSLGLSRDGLIGHAILVSLDPPLFCDNNEDNRATSQPRYRRFSNVDEMLKALVYHIDLIYGYDMFELISYEKL